MAENQSQPKWMQYLSLIPFLGQGLQQGYSKGMEDRLKQEEFKRKHAPIAKTLGEELVTPEMVEEEKKKMFMETMPTSHAGVPSQAITPSIPEDISTLPLARRRKAFIGKWKTTPETPQESFLEIQKSIKPQKESRKYLKEKYVVSELGYDPSFVEKVSGIKGMDMSLGEFENRIRMNLSNMRNSREGMNLWTKMFIDATRKLQQERAGGKGISEGTIAEVNTLGSPLGYTVEVVEEEIEKDPNFFQKIFGITPEPEKTTRTSIAPIKKKDTTRIKVIDKASGQSGTIEAWEFDPNKYEKQ